MNLDTFIRQLPKMELHVHLHGTLSAQTLVDLAAKNKVALPHYDTPDDLYRYADLQEFLQAVSLVGDVLKDGDDLHRITYEAMADSARNGAKRIEMHFSPFIHMKSGMSYATVLDAVSAGAKDAQKDFGCQYGLVSAINRELGAKYADDVLDLVLEHRTDDVLGIGLDFYEIGNPPELFEHVFQRAARAGLKCCAHAGEDGPSDYVKNSLDHLQCDRIDHGYHVIDDPHLCQHCIDQEVIFAVCPSTTTYTTKWRDLSSPDHAIKQMADLGLKLTINTDDPPMFNTDLANEYRLLVENMGFGPKQLKQLALNSIDGAWIDESEKRQLRSEWSREIDGMIADLEARTDPNE